jgi:hypothetical protein
MCYLSLHIYRVEIRHLENGRHQLVINKAAMGDAGLVEARTPSNYGDEMITSACSLHVAKGEERPVIGDVAPVSGVANKACSWKVPFQVRAESTHLEA